ncbi:amidohydrolase family protein [Helicobacter sp. 12S02232-10]|uniref:metal-dependent hydrolase family protein n=1 Tax=Helicobacter sp. 12S02232-10 TaxID=1476197 RepID=UPI000BA6197F|nr:amidohydrolase family protein [Helicobacter sp. 12S02232-10]
MKRREAFALGGVFAFGGILLAKEALSDEKKQSVLIRNAVVFDGKRLVPKTNNVLIVGNKITTISSDTIAAPKNAKVIDAGGKFLMPGLSDAHWHLMFAAAPLDSVDLPDPGLFYATAIKEAKHTLLRGFTTIRDMAGASFGIKRAIDSEMILGPRVFPSGAFISQTSGHGDFAPAYENAPEFGGERSELEKLGNFRVVNGVPEVLAAVREQLKKGASQIKIGAGGGMISDFDPMDSVQFSLEEIRAAVGAAKDWGTYVCSHVYTVDGIKKALDGGVRSIEHGQLADEATIKRMAGLGAWLSLQPFEGKFIATAKGKILDGKWRETLRLGLKHKVKYAFGTDILFNPNLAALQNEALVKFADILSPLQTLVMATSGNAELFEMSGKRNPYLGGKLGVLEPGAWADMILIDGDPLKDIEVLKQYNDKFVLIVKDGNIVKNII